MSERTLSINEINEQAQNNPKEFILKCETRYNTLIFDIAEKLINHKNNSPVVLLTGPSSSGKTTTASRIKDKLTENGIKVHTVSLDDYYLTHGLNKLPLDEFGNIDFESPDCLDLPLLNEHMQGIINGDTVEIPKFDFEKRSRVEEVYKLKLSENEMVIFEGIHALNSSITSKIGDKAAKIYIAPKTEVLFEDGTCASPNMLRLARRMVRDRNFRGAEFSRTLDMWQSVRNGEKLYIDPFASTAHFTADTYLAYESSIFFNILNQYKDELIPIFMQKNLEQMVYLLDKFSNINYSEFIPKNSLLREFIG